MIFIIINECSNEDLDENIIFEFYFIRANYGLLGENSGLSLNLQCEQRFLS